MSRATHVILKHYSSTLENPNHEDCPPGKNLWCSYERDVASGTNYHQPIKDPSPIADVAEVQPLFDCLGSKEFLAGCEDGKIQNTECERVLPSCCLELDTKGTIKFSIGD